MVTIIDIQIVKGIEIFDDAIWWYINWYGW